MARTVMQGLRKAAACSVKQRNRQVRKGGGETAEGFARGAFAGCETGE